MIKSLRLALLYFGVVLIFCSLFMPWTKQPSYTVFKIADYATTFGKYFGFARAISILSILFIVLCCITLISIGFNKLVLLSTSLLGFYGIGFVIYTAIVIERLNLNSSLVPSAIGPYVTILGAVLVLSYFSIGYITKER